MDIYTSLSDHVKSAVKKQFDVILEHVELQPTRKDFEGDITVVVFPMLSKIKGNPVTIGTTIGEELSGSMSEVVSFNVIKGFLNLVLSDEYLIGSLERIRQEDPYGIAKGKPTGSILVEYSSPNTNKPLHLGHVRNNLLGYSVSKILEASGKRVHKIQIINDRGIHICKSMLAWKKFGSGETPEKAGMKGDKLVGKYYVAFDKAFKEEVNELIDSGKSETEASAQAPILLEAQEMLRKWEAGDPEVVALWKKMNSWVYSGFEETYRNLGVEFDKLYYESDTYLLGREVVQEGLDKGVFFKKDDGSVWIDLSAEGLDEKIVLRADGTSVYITQDIGTAVQRVADHPGIEGMVYTVGNEQDYHFRVLFLILKKLGYSWAENLYHLSYGMVDLPEGRMKSREGTVVDADDLISEMTRTAENISKELGKLEGYSEEQKQELYRKIGLGALKYFILKVDPKKRILFNPEESVDFQGNTGPFIQYTHARICSILRKSKVDYQNYKVSTANSITLHEKEKELIKILLQFPEVVSQAASNYSPALIANYVYDLVKEFNSFYQQVTILGESEVAKKMLRIQLSDQISKVIATAMGLLGIEVPERM